MKNFFQFLATLLSLAGTFVCLLGLIEHDQYILIVGIWSLVSGIAIKVIYDTKD